MLSLKESLELHRQQENAHKTQIGVNASKYLKEIAIEHDESEKEFDRTAYREASDDSDDD